MKAKILDFNDLISFFSGPTILFTSSLINWAVPNPVGSCHGVTAGVINLGSCCVVVAARL